jgi:hypothetical protein
LEYAPQGIRINAVNPGTIRTPITTNGSKMAEKTGKSGGPLPTQHVETLAQKLSDGQLAVFVGAGLSHLAPPNDGSARRLPLWRELTDQVAKACRIDSANFDHDPLDVFDAIVHGDSRGALEEAVREAAAPAAMPLKPKMAAMIAITKNTAAYCNMMILLQRFVIDIQDVVLLLAPQG